MTNETKLKFDKLISLQREYNNNEEELQKIEEAFLLAEKLHSRQKRMSGEPYIYHLLEVSIILSKSRAPYTAIVIGLLHDILEDTDIFEEEIENQFGTEILSSIKSLTKIKETDRKLTTEKYFKQLIIGISENEDIILIKLADRLHNMRTLTHMSPEKQKIISEETMNIYIPMSARLGLHWMKSELEDLCFFYLQPEEYKMVKNYRDKDTKRSKKFLDSIVEIVNNALISEEANIVTVYGREKHLYSIYKKMENKNRSYEEVLDILAIRVVATDNVECYRILGILSKHFNQIPNRIKDYISTPKENFYEALHTTVLIDKVPFEFQIMTSRMEANTKIGLTSHFSYKEKHNKFLSSNNFIEYIKEYSETLGNKKVASEFMNVVSKDLFTKNITVLTPTGDKVTVPSGSTALDFAFKIHSDVGLHASGATIDSAIVNLNQILEEGDIVEIFQSKELVPIKAINWVRTRKAADLIRDKYIENENISSNIETSYGKQIMSDFLERNPEYSDILTTKAIEAAARLMKYDSLNSFYIALAKKEVKTTDLVDSLRKSSKTFRKTVSKQKKIQVQSKAFEFANASKLLNSKINFKPASCNPVYGEDVIGEISAAMINRDKKILVHRKNCYKVKSLEESRAKAIVPLKWVKSEEDNYNSSLKVDIEANDRRNLLKDLINAIYDGKSDIIYVESKYIDDNESVKINLELKVNNIKHLNKIFALIYDVPGVINIKRK